MSLSPPPKKISFSLLTRSLRQPAVAHEDQTGDFTTTRRVLLLTVMAAIIGVLSALVAYALLWLIGVMTNLAYFQRFSSALVTPSPNALGRWALFVPAVGGLLIGLLARFGSERIRGHGIPEALEAILLGRSRMSLKVAVLKPLSSALSIGTGGPFGAEGPIIMTGGALGSLFAQLFDISAAERKTLLVAGAAAGMAAIFATPVAAVLLAVELLLFEWKPRSLIPVACAAIVAAALRILLLGWGPLFPMLPHAALGMPGLGLCLLVGIVAGLGSGLLTKVVYSFEDLFSKLPLHWMWWPAIGGLAVGVGGLLEPRALGVGYDLIRELLAGRDAGGMLARLLVIKALIWAIALGSGTSGGVLAPLLILGGAMGAVEAQWLHLGDSGVWAMMSMAAMMGGTMRSPLTAMIFALELTNDVTMLPGLLVATMAADAVTVLLLKRSILTEKVARRGHHVMREYVVSALQRLRIEEAMDPEIPTLPASTQVAEMVALLGQPESALGRQHAWVLVDEQSLLMGMVTRGDLLRALGQGDVHKSVLEVGATTVEVAFPDELVEEAVIRMVHRDIGRLPVVSRDNNRKLVGYFGRDAVMRTLLRRLDEEQVEKAGWLTGKLRARAASRALAARAPVVVPPSVVPHDSTTGHQASL